MAKIKIVAFIENPAENVGPYNYEITPIDFCGEVKFIYAGNTYKEALKVSSDNPSIDVILDIDTTNCPDLLGKLRLQGNSGVCISFVEKEILNVCKGLMVRICPLSVSNDMQLLNAGVSGGNGKHSYVWKVFSNNVFIKKGQNLQSVEIDRGTDSGSFVVDVTVTDENECVATHKITVPSISSLSPVLKDYDFQRKCTDPVTQSIVIDVVALGNDPDGTLDLSSIEVTQAPVSGTYVIDYATGYIVYAGNLASAGTQILKYRVKDNNGKWSNEATATLIITPCDAAPSSTDDVATVPCDTTVVVDILSNDVTNDGTIDPSTVEIISPPLKGTYQILSDGKIQYTPNTGESGVDLIRYRVQDTSGDWSDVSTLQLNIETCCDGHTAGMDVSCDGQYNLTATGTGVVTETVSEDFAYKLDTSTGYVPGSVAAVPNECKEDFIKYDVNPYGGNATVYNTENTISRVERLSNFTFNVEIGWPDITTQSKLDSLLAFIGEQVVRFGFINLNQYPGSYYVPNMMSIQTTVFVEGGTDYYGLKFSYSTDIPLVGCRSDIVQKTIGTHNILSAITIGNSETYSFGSGNMQLANFAYTNLRSVLFRRTIIRNDCPIIELIYKSELDVEEGCDSLITEQVGGPVAPNAAFTEIYDVCVEGDIQTLSTILVSGTNILTSQYSIPDDAQKIEDYLNNYLSGDGSAEVYYATNKLIIQIIETTKVFQQVTSNLGNTPFSTL